MYNSGYIESKIDGTEPEFRGIKNKGLLSEYSYKKYLPGVIDQGSDPICIPCSLSCYINWKINVGYGAKGDNNVDVYGLFEKRDGNDEGMNFKDAFRILYEDGVKTDNGIVKIKNYAKIGSEMGLKMALVANGPCMGVLPVYNSDCDDEFWNEKYGDLEGYHAVAIVGYCKDGFIIRNSWGERYGEDGYTLLRNKYFRLFRELWTIY